MTLFICWFVIFYWFKQITVIKLPNLTKYLQTISPCTCTCYLQVHWRPNRVAERSSALDSSSGVVRMWVRISAWPVAARVSLSKTLNHNCFVLQMGRKAVGPVCCVMHVKEPRTLIVKEKGLAPVFLDLRLEHPAGWICARYKSFACVFCKYMYMYNVHVKQGVHLANRASKWHTNVHLCIAG